MPPECTKQKCPHSASHFLVKEGNNLSVTISHSKITGSLAVLVVGGNAGSKSNQRGNNTNGTLGTSLHERCPTSLTRSVDVTAKLKQHFYHFDRAGQCCPVNWCVSGLLK
eukprot:c20717_g4_i1.p1 GENE.c20717_g4_i1~~c20717_g4_i1.p1  ORF type:complete len:110 (+),score=12.34 c20717_g4_i1:27-356(+)